MKKLLCIIASVMLVACSNDTELSPASGTGYVVIENLAAADAHMVAVGTRAVDNDLAVQIINSAAEVVYQYAAGSSALDAKLELPAGTYTLHAYTANLDARFAEGEPGEAKYDGTYPFTVVAERTSHVSYQVPMTNSAVSVDLPEVFDTWFSDYQFAVTDGVRTVSLTPGQTAWFDAGSTLSYTITATNADGEPGTSSGSIQLAAGTHYTITYELEQSTFAIKKAAF